MNKIEIRKGEEAVNLGPTTRAEAEALLAAYKIKNPEKYEIKKAAGEFDKLLASFGPEEDEAAKEAEKEAKKAAKEAEKAKTRGDK